MLADGLCSIDHGLSADHCGSLTSSGLTSMFELEVLTTVHRAWLKPSTVGLMQSVTSQRRLSKCRRPSSWCLILIAMFAFCVARIFTSPRDGWFPRAQISALGLCHELALPSSALLGIFWDAKHDGSFSEKRFLVGLQG